MPLTGENAGRCCCTRFERQGVTSATVKKLVGCNVNIY
ncbi:Hypothetical protein SMB2099_4297 [Serratia marcescens SMB2099]|nr:Hypothetical protein SMB2099_4297 [Serratia marcescens SMB2099]